MCFMKPPAEKWILMIQVLKKKPAMIKILTVLYLSYNTTLVEM